MELEQRDFDLLEKIYSDHVKGIYSRYDSSDEEYRIYNYFAENYLVLPRSSSKIIRLTTMGVTILAAYFKMKYKKILALFEILEMFFSLLDKTKYQFNRDEIITIFRERDYLENEIYIALNYGEQNGYYDARWSMGSLFPSQITLKRKGENALKSPNLVHNDYIDIYNQLKDTNKGNEHHENKIDSDLFPQDFYDQLISNQEKILQKLDHVINAVQTGFLLNVKADEKLFMTILEKMPEEDGELDFSNISKEDQILLDVLAERSLLRYIYNIKQKGNFLKTLWDWVVKYNNFNAFKNNVKINFPDIENLLEQIIDHVNQ
ncbi:MAG: hypothetical protein INQ03_00760 [Candidatus Heimdallarchaeota archaeon]|nr:hypothetical protein [Candidatus Heimdallarchaeota archaeon]